MTFMVSCSMALHACRHLVDNVTNVSSKATWQQTFFIQIMTLAAWFEPVNSPAVENRLFFFEQVKLKGQTNRIMRTMHRIIGANVTLKEMGVTNNNKCSFCLIVKDTIQHIFWECKQPTVLDTLFGPTEREMYFLLQIKTVWMSNIIRYWW